MLQEEQAYAAENAALTRRDVINVLISTSLTSELRFQVRSCTSFIVFFIINYNIATTSKKRPMLVFGKIELMFGGWKLPVAAQNGMAPTFILFCYYYFLIKIICLFNCRTILQLNKAKLFIKKL